jgi:hypothetical protein
MYLHTQTFLTIVVAIVLSLLLFWLADLLEILL